MTYSCPTVQFCTVFSAAARHIWPSKIRSAVRDVSPVRSTGTRCRYGTDTSVRYAVRYGGVSTVRSTVRWYLYSTYYGRGGGCRYCTGMSVWYGCPVGPFCEMIPLFFPMAPILKCQLSLSPPLDPGSTCTLNEMSLRCRITRTPTAVATPQAKTQRAAVGPSGAADPRAE